MFKIKAWSFTGEDEVMDRKLIMLVLLAATLIIICTGGHPYTYTGAALGDGLGALTDAGAGYDPRWRRGAHRGLWGDVLGRMSGQGRQQFQPLTKGDYQGYGPV